MSVDLAKQTAYVLMTRQNYRVELSKQTAYVMLLPKTSTGRRRQIVNN